MKSRIVKIALMLALTMVLALVACSNNSNNNPSSNTPSQNDTPSPPPAQESSGNDNQTTASTPDNGNDNASDITSSDDNFFHGIDDDVYPDFLKVKIGTDFTTYHNDRYIEIEFTGATEEEIDELLDYFRAEATTNMLNVGDRIREGLLMFDWGRIVINADLDNGTLKISSEYE